MLLKSVTDPIAAVRADPIFAKFSENRKQLKKIWSVVGTLESLSLVSSRINNILPNYKFMFTHAADKNST